MQGGYARVSTEQQAHAVALENQIMRLQKAGAEVIFSDVESRANNARDGLEKAIAALENGEIECLWVVRLDRLTASPGMIERICDVVVRTGRPVYGLDEVIDLSSIDGQFTAGLAVQFAKREVETIKLRSQRGHDAKRERQRANAVPPFGYINDRGTYKEDTTPFLCLIEDDSELSRWDLLEDLINIFLETKSITASVTEFHNKYGVIPQKNRKRSGSRSTGKILELSVSGVGRLLRNPILRGGTAYNVRQFKGLDNANRKIYGTYKPRAEWDVQWGTHEAVAIAPDVAAEIDSILDTNANLKKAHQWNGQLQPLSGKIRCGQCGSRCKSSALKKQKNGVFRYYQCRAYMETKRLSEPKCSQKTTIRDDAAIAAVIEALVGRAKDISKFGREPSTEGNKEIARLKSQLEGIDSLGDNPALAQAKKDIQSQINVIRQRQRIIAQNLALKEDELLTLYQNAEFWTYLTTDELRDLFRRLVDRVVILNGEVTDVFLNI